MHGMIYGAQQTIKLIRLCVFPEEGPAGGCSGPSPAPSLFEPPLPSISLPPRVTGAFFCVCFCLAAPTSSLLQLTCEAVSLACPDRRSGPSDTGPITNRVPKLTAAHHTMVLSQQDFGLQPLFTLLLLLQTPNLRSRSRSGCGMMPIEGAHCFTSCPVRHTPQRLYPTGS